MSDKGTTTVTAETITRRQLLAVRKAARAVKPRSIEDWRLYTSAQVALGELVLTSGGPIAVVKAQREALCPLRRRLERAAGRWEVRPRFSRTEDDGTRTVFFTTIDSEAPVVAGVTIVGRGNELAPMLDAVAASGLSWVRCRWPDGRGALVIQAPNAEAA